MPYFDEEGNEVEPWETDDNPYKGRFESYRSEADRRATTYQQNEALLEDLKSGDAAKQQAAAEALGMEFIADEPIIPDPEGEDPRLAELLAKYSELETKMTEREQRDNDAAVAAEINARIEALNLGDEAEGNLVLAAALRQPVGEDGLPDIAAAHAAIVARDEARFEGWKKSKRTSVTPRGQSAAEEKNILDMTAEERIEWAMEKHGME
jgi:uncharacterized protein YdcH (DUF465 family)